LKLSRLSIESAVSATRNQGFPGRLAGSVAVTQSVPNEVNLALKLIEGMTAEFDPAKYHDTYTEDVKKSLPARTVSAVAS
jgi:non-homologous end joining protein Ku